MKHQYVGDVNDYRKYALLRALAAGGANRIGVCWMLTPDSGTDGGKLAYLAQPGRHRHFDAELFDLLEAASKQEDWRRLATIEEMGAIPGATYFSEEIPAGVAARQSYFAWSGAALAACGLVFFDPDNGMAVKSVTKAQKAAIKFIFPDEIAATYQSGRAVLIYQHFPFIQKDVFIAACAEALRTLAPDATIWAFRTAHVLFLLLLHPDSPASLYEAAARAAGAWPKTFMTGTQLHPPPYHDPLKQLLATLEAEAAQADN